MTELLHIKGATITESDDGNVVRITVVSHSLADAERLLPAVRQEMLLRTPGPRGTQYSGILHKLTIATGKDDTVDVALTIDGGEKLGTLVGTNVSVEPAQMTLVPIDTPLFDALMKERTAVESDIDKAAAIDKAKILNATIDKTLGFEEI